MNHQFDIEEAQEYGVNSAIILNNLRFWVAKNKANNKHFHEGKYWTYNSVKAFSALFPYLSEKQIRTALENLETLGVIGKGNFSDNKYERANWFCLLGQDHLPCRANGAAQDGESITDSKPYRKPNSKKKEIIIPTIEELKLYFTENGYTESSAVKAFNYYACNDWKDRDGKEVKSWKQKMQGVWFKPENKQQSQTGSKLSF